MMRFALSLAGAQWPTRLVACLGAAICLALTFVVCAQLPLARADLPIIVAPLGASAVLVFAVRASPLAQPWPVVGGNILSTLIGVAVFRLVPNVGIAAGVAVGMAILAMSLARCLHPPGGAAALTAVIGSHGIHAAGFEFAFAPVGINSIALVSLAMFFHRATGHAYPHRAPPPALPLPSATPAPGLHAADIDAALAEAPDGFDIAPDDLAALLVRAEWHAGVRRGERAPSTADVPTPTPVR